VRSQTTDKLVIAALACNAGAGGAILPLAADFVACRDAVVLNPHYKNMDGFSFRILDAICFQSACGWDCAMSAYRELLARERPNRGKRATRS